MSNFWANLKKPFTVLGPMDGITDFAFRKIITGLGKPDVMFTEFTSCEGLLSDGARVTKQKLQFALDQQPIVAQIWGREAKNYFEAAKIISKFGFAGIDINMGCPDRTVVKYGAGSALIKTPEFAKEAIEETKKGAGDLPVSVKTRIGFSKPEIENWIGFLLEQKLAALTIHLRTTKELSKVPAHWEMMEEIIKLRDKISPDTLIIGNGDIKSLDEIYEKYKEYKCEGFMVGTGILSNPWFFDKNVDLSKITVKQRVDLYLKHIKTFKDIKENKQTSAIRKFCKVYINNFDGAAKLRDKLMDTKNISDLESQLETFSEI